MRHDDRTPDQLRPCSIEPGFIGKALGSALIATGGTRVICTASLEERAPAWLRNGGWVTAEYVMLPGATSPRGRRDPGGRGKEIQRLIGRSLRAAVDLTRLVGPEGEALSLVVDCDVIEADGGTRTASITGGWVALRLALDRLLAQGRLGADPMRAAVAAVSVGLLARHDGGDPLAVLDLDYPEDSTAVVDLNVVALPGQGSVSLVEVQGTGEGGSFSRAQLDTMLDLAEIGIARLHRAQEEALDAAG
ncbi:ribonuclease PH [Paraliomyxa miuraensis]|uniref:ribonuclease PH n=1 Tax=Paraliomyxa miuraensis TaxID=376150 RepID=UPI00225304E0|nr:ribonuclease PH [Paraliomyxa miuraensis]MCX4245722.1 ribonuclease PH [Paraliomyxa miuraensis]